MKQFAVTTLVFLYMSTSNRLLANQAATIAFSFGQVQILADPRDAATGAAPRVLFRGKHYTEKGVKKGDRLEEEEVLRTGPRSRAKLIFANGDQFIVPANSAYKIGWDRAEGTDKPEVTLFWGALRAIVSKDKERSNLKVRSRSMVLGVRGTDFFVDQRNAQGESEISVLRGEVTIEPVGVKNSAPVSIPGGYTAKAKVIDENKSRNLHLAIGETSKQQLDRISSINHQMGKDSQTSSPHIKDLENKAVSTALSDMKQYQPDLYEKMKSDGVVFQSSADLDNAFVAQLISEASEDPDSKEVIIGFDPSDFEETAPQKIPIPPSVLLGQYVELEKESRQLVPLYAASLVTALAGGVALTEKVDDGDDIDSSEVEEKRFEDRSKRTKRAGRAAVVVGGATLLGTSVISLFSYPLQSCDQKLKKQKESQADQDIKALDCLESTASFGRAVSWSSAITNFVANVYVVSEARTATTRAAAVLGLASSLTPLLYPNVWHEIEAEQYQDISAYLQPAPLFKPATGEFAPGLVAGVSF